MFTLIGTVQTAYANTTLISEQKSSFPAVVILALLILQFVLILFLLCIFFRQMRKISAQTQEIQSLKNHIDKLQVLLDCVADLGKISYFSGILDNQPPGSVKNTQAYKFAIARSESLSPEDKKEYLKKYQQFFSGEIKSFSLNYSLSVNGELKQLRDYAQIVKNPDSNQLNIILATMDITELAKQSLELANADTLMKAIYDNMPGHIFIKKMSSDFVYLSCNNSFSSLIQRHPSEVVGKTDFDLFDRNLAQRIRVSNLHIAATHSIADKRWIFTTPDGKEHATRFISRTLKRPDGEEIIIGFGIDVTRQERLTGKLRRRNKELRLLLAQTNAAVMLLDNNLKLSCATQQMLEHFPEEQRTGDTPPSCRELFNCNISDSSLCPAVAAINTRKMQICNNASCGSLKIKPLLNENSITAYLALTLTDNQTPETNSND